MIVWAWRTSLSTCCSFPAPSTLVSQLVLQSTCVSNLRDIRVSVTWACCLSMGMGLCIDRSETDYTLISFQYNLTHEPVHPMPCPKAEPSSINYLLQILKECCLPACLFAVEEDAYSKFVTDHGGHTNAYTASENTNYQVCTPFYLRSSRNSLQIRLWCSLWMNCTEASTLA